MTVNCFRAQKSVNLTSRRQVPEKFSKPNHLNRYKFTVDNSISMITKYALKQKRLTERLQPISMQCWSSTHRWELQKYRVLSEVHNRWWIEHSYRTWLVAIEEKLNLSQALTELWRQSPSNSNQSTVKWRRFEYIGDKRQTWLIICG